MERHFDDELNNLKTKLRQMGDLAESMLAAAIHALEAHDLSALPEIQRKEDEVNRLQIQIDEYCLRLIALHQPTARDLRLILGVAKTNTELERLGDEAINICNKVPDLRNNPAFNVFADFPAMSALASSMIRESLYACFERDVFKARNVIMRDDQLDDYKRNVSAHLTTVMSKDPATVEDGIKMILLARNLERIGDLATNIAENTIFVEEGLDVRHHAEDKSQPHGEPTPGK
jgi:phosphate transport system protein